MKKRFSQRIFLKRLEETHKTEEPSPKKETERTEEHSDQKEDLSETCNTFVKEIKKVDKFGKLLKKEMWFETREDNTRRIQMKVYNKKCICFEKLHEIEEVNLENIFVSNSFLNEKTKRVNLQK